MSDRHGGAAQRAADKLIRIHNVLLLAVVVGGLGCILYVQTTHFHSGRRPAFMWMLTAASIGLPILALAATAAATNGIIKRFVRRIGDLVIDPQAVAPLFFRAKLVSMTTLTLAGFFADACLLFGHRTLEFALAAIPIILMLITRPARGGVATFVTLVDTIRQDMNGPAARSDDATRTVALPDDDGGGRNTT